MFRHLIGILMTEMHVFIISAQMRSTMLILYYFLYSITSEYFKRIVYAKMKLVLFTYLHVVLNLYAVNLQKIKYMFK